MFDKVQSVRGFNFNEKLNDDLGDLAQYHSGVRTEQNARDSSAEAARLQ